MRVFFCTAPTWPRVYILVKELFEIPLPNKADPHGLAFLSHPLQAGSHCHLFHHFFVHFPQRKQRPPQGVLMNGREEQRLIFHSVFRT